MEPFPPMHSPPVLEIRGRIKRVHIGLPNGRIVSVRRIRTGDIFSALGQSGTTVLH